MPANPTTLEQEEAVSGTHGAQVTWFPNATSVTPVETTSLQSFIETCKQGVYQDLIIQIRAALSEGKTSTAGGLKRRLPCITVSCSMSSRARNAPVRARVHTGWLQCDFDGKENIGLDQSETRRELEKDPHVGAVFVGPSGVGIKCAIRIDSSRHLESFHAAADYFMDTYGLQIDQACKDVERLCFVSYDPDAWCRKEEAVVLPIIKKAAQPLAEKMLSLPRETERTPAQEQHAELTAADVREILGWLPKRPDYDTWLRVASGVFSTLPLETAVQLLNEWAPEEHPGEYLQKYRNRLKKVTIRTVIHYAQQNGFDASAAAKRRSWFGNINVGRSGREKGHAHLLQRDEQEQKVSEEEQSALLYEEEQIGDAKMFIRQCQDDFAYDHLSQCWRAYDEDTRIWTKDIVGTNQIVLSATVVEEYQKVIESIERSSAAQKNKEVTKMNNALIENIKKRCANLRKAPYIAQVTSLTQRFKEVLRPATEYDKNRQLLGIADGYVIDFEARNQDGVHGVEVRKAERNDLISVASSVRHDADATCPAFDAFLFRAFAEDQEMVDYWWRIVGYSMTGFVDHDALFFCYGLGANGKSTGLMVLRFLLGDQLSTMVDVNTLLGGGNADSAMDYKKSMLEGKRLVITDELPDSKKINESMVKGLLGGEDIVARRPYERPYTFSPTHKIWMVGNHKPKISGVDHGIWRRIHLIPWEVTIPVAERKSRSEMWRTFQDELPGILNRAIDGYNDYRMRGALAPPAKVRAATEEYRMEEDSLQQFVSERLVKMPGVNLQTREVFSEYKNWCARSGEPEVVGTANKLARMLKQPPYSMEVGLGSKNINTVFGYSWVE
jgi:P4 family phage/plasmid primase-like protien